MKRSSLIGHTIELLDTVRASTHPADRLVQEFFRARKYLGAGDRRRISEWFYSILRNYRLLQFFCDRARSGMRAIPHPSLALWAAYALRVEREAPSTIEPDIAGLWRSFGPTTDCMSFLDALASAPLPENVITEPLLLVALKYSCPASLVEEWTNRWGTAEAEVLAAALNQPAPTVVRVNTLKTTVEECRADFLQHGIEAKRTLLSPFGLALKKRVAIHALPPYRKGWFEMQDEGSQLVAMLVEPPRDGLVIDACAGGGGKALHLAALMGNSGCIIALDIDAVRLRSARERSVRSGVSIMHAYHSHAAELKEYLGKADAVLVDAPCSGVGTFRRNPAAKLRFTESYAAAFPQTQKSLLESSARFVKPGGRLVYATCTIVRQENEDVIEWFLSRHPEFSHVPALEILARQGVHVEGSGPYLTLLTHKTGTDSFFAAVLQRASR